MHKHPIWPSNKSLNDYFIDLIKISKRIDQIYVNTIFFKKTQFFGDRKKIAVTQLKDGRWICYFRGTGIDGKSKI